MHDTFKEVPEMAVSSMLAALMGIRDVMTASFPLACDAFAEISRRQLGAGRTERLGCA
jgi:hypothetical protein